MMNHYVQVIIGSLFQSLMCACVSLAVALPVGYCVYRYSFWGRTFFIALLCVLSILPTKVAAVAVEQTFGFIGFVGIITSIVLINIPFAILLMHIAYTRIDKLSLWIASELGATSWRCYVDIVWPQIKSAVLSTGLLIFVLSFCSVKFSLFFGSALYHNTPEVMMEQAYAAGDTVAYRCYMVLRLCVLFLLYALVAPTMRYVASNTHITVNYVVQLLHSVWWRIVLLAVTLFMVVPLCYFFAHGIQLGMLSYVGAIPSMQHDLLLHAPVMYVVCNSLRLGLLSSLFALVVGSILAVGMQMYGRLSQTGIAFITLLPFVLGRVGCGVLFDGLSQASYISPFYAEFSSHIFMNYPIVYRVLQTRSSAYDIEWTYSAQSLGATAWEAYKTVFIPFMQPALAHAFCIAFSLSMTEVGAGMIFAGQTGLTLPMAIRIYRAAGEHVGVYGLTFVLLKLVFLVVWCTNRLDTYLAKE